ncbi:MAG: transketolase family protein [Thermoplasmata archaeon]|nr:transketolase family protein [Thermoplasmata archaeon]
MNAPTLESLRDAYDRALVELAESNTNIVAVDADYLRPAPENPFRDRFPERFIDVSADDPSTVVTSARLAGDGKRVFARALALHAASHGYHAVRASVCEPKADVKIVADPGAAPGSVGPAGHAMVEDLGLMRGLPGMTVVAPADAPETAGVVRALGGFHGPAYLRFGSESLPVVTDGMFEIGKASELRPGADLTLIAVGRPVARAVEASTELARVGIGARVLDFASIKPYDAKALFRAARETGAILTLEDHSVLSGLGALVASATAEEYPVPVRRMGAPDLFPSKPITPGTDPFGLSLERCLEEAYELLRARGKVT